MKLGVLTVMFGDKPLDEVLSYLKEQGVEAVEIGCGGFPGKKLCDPDVLLNDETAFKAFMDTLTKYGLTVSALSCHGNPVHPNAEVAASYHSDFEKAVLLAEKMGIDTVITFSGCPGGAPGDTTPNWPTCPWPDDFLGILEYQWNDVLIPYWKKTAAFALEHKVTKIAFEMHPGFCVYNPYTLLRLREAVGGDILGANFDPSHLIWQGMDPVMAIRELKGAIHHFHAKDTRIDPANTAVNGVLDTRHYGDEAVRSCVFRTVGYGMDEKVWRAMISELVLAGYDGAISIEHEDSLMDPIEGLEKAIAFLKNIVIKAGKPTEIWWA